MNDKISLVRQTHLDTDSFISIAAGLHASSDFNETYRRAKELKNFGHSNFDAIDEDKSGRISHAEIKLARLQASDPYAVSQLMLLEKGYETIRFVAQTAPEKPGISRSDLGKILTFFDPVKPKADKAEAIMGSTVIGLASGLLGNMTFSLATKASWGDGGLIAIPVSKYPTASLLFGVALGAAVGVSFYFDLMECRRTHNEASKQKMAELLNS